MPFHYLGSFGEMKDTYQDVQVQTRPTILSEPHSGAVLVKWSGFRSLGCSCHSPDPAACFGLSRPSLRCRMPLHAERNRQAASSMWDSVVCWDMHRLWAPQQHLARSETGAGPTPRLDSPRRAIKS